MARYAKGTDVPADKTKAQICDLIRKRGATDYFMGTLGGREFVAFKYAGFPIRLECPPPDPDEYETDRQLEREVWRQWRVMLIWLKGQLEAIDCGIFTAGQAFLSQIQLPDGRTVAQAVEQDGRLKLGGAVLALPGPVKTEAK